MTLDKYIATNYDKFKQHAFNISRRDQLIYEDLLHDSLLSVLSSKHVDHLIDSEEFEYYLIRVMYLSINSPQSPFHRKVISYNKNRRAFKDYANEVDETWLGARMTNEQLDILISRLPEFEQLIFQEYLLEDFSYHKLAQQTGIPRMFLHRSIKETIKILKQNVIR